jgi:hypothetical protein
MLGHGADMARGTARRDHRRIAQGGAALQVDGHNILGLVVVQGRQDAPEQVALRRRLFCWSGGFLGGNGGLFRRSSRFFDGSSRLLARWLLDGFCRFLCPLCGFRLGSRLFASGLLDTSQG